jgi:two-component system sensor histidine kinase/response regulator
MIASIRQQSEQSAAAEQLFHESMHQAYVDTDRLFAILMVLQWLSGIVLAFTISPLTWIGEASQLHVHVFASFFLGAAISLVPVLLAWLLPGHTVTRHAMAVAQMLWSALLIHLTGGRLETHFHVFGSLAFLAFYRDWRVLVTATIVVAGDHFIRGVWWPQSVFGVMVESPYRWIEHAAWVLFEDVILMRSCFRGVQEARAIAQREASLQIANEHLEAQFQVRLKAENEVRRLYKDLQTAHDAAIAASQIKSNFLANMSHELRTPLNAIIGYSELLQLLAEKKNDLTFHEDLNRIQNAGKHLLSLINDILDISKIEAGKMDLILVDLDPVCLREEVEDTIRPLAEKNGNQLVLEFDPNCGLIRGDEIRLKQCLLNLLSNACKFTHQGRVRLTVRSTWYHSQPHIAFDVEDSGIGLSEEQLKRLFQPFTQADASTTRKYGGTGLGLALTKQLVEAMGGEITVQSRLGAGSTFTIYLPCHEAETKFMEELVCEVS